MRCTPAGSGCASIAGADQRSYTLQSADVDQTVKARVTASNTVGSGQADAPLSSVVAGNIPANDVAPTVSGSAEVGKSLSTQTGSWSGSTPIAYGYQWQRCDAAGNACQDLSNATQAAYLLTAQDADMTMRVRVTATNTTGHAGATSAPRVVQGAGCTTTFQPASGAWSTAANWSGASAPTASDRACVPAGRSALLSGTSSTIGSLSGAGEVKVSSTLSLTDSGATSDIGSLSLDGGGTLAGASDLIINASLTWTNGTMSGSGRTIVASGANGSITSGTLSRTLVNSGSLTGSGSDFFEGDSSAVLDNRGTFTLNIVDSPYGDERGLLLTAPDATPTVRNTGIFRKTSGGSTTIDWRMDNDGTVQPGGYAPTSAMTFHGGGTPGHQSTGSWANGTYWYRGTYELGPTTQISGTALSTATIVASSINLTDDSELKLSGGTLQLADGTSQVGKLTVNGDISGAGDLIVNTSLSWTNGTMSGGGTTILAPSAMGTITSGTLGRTFVNRGNMTYADGGTAAWLFGAPGGVLDNEGLLDLNSQTQDAPQMRVLSGSPVALLLNRGTVRKSGGTGDTEVKWAYADQGITQQLTSGRLLFEGPQVGTGVGSSDSAAPAPSEYTGGYNAASPALSTCADGDPVSCITGDYFENVSDLSVSGRGVPLSAQRSYSAQAAQTDAAAGGTPAGGLGAGWTQPYATRLELPAGYVRLHGANGATALWKANSDGTFSAPARVKATLARGASNSYVVTFPDQTSDVFDNTGRLLRQVDRNGYATTITYDSNGHISYVQDEAGRRLTYSDDAGGRITSITDPISRTVSYAYDSNGDLATVTDVAGQTWHYGYDGKHRIVSIRDPGGHETINTYDAESRVSSQTDPSGAVTRFAYTEAGMTVTDPHDHQTRYDVTGGLISGVVHGLGTDEQSDVAMVRDASGNVTQRTDPDGQITKVDYDAAGNATKITDPLGRISTMTYSPTNDLLTVTDPASTTTYAYDSTGNVTSISRPLTGSSNTATTTYAYDPAKPGDLVSVTNPIGKVWTYTHDAYGNRTSMTDPTGAKTTTAYNQLGWATATVSPRGNASGANPADYQTTTVYNDRGQPTTQTDPDSATVHTVYDAVGNPTSVTQPGDKTTTTTYDELDRPITVTRPDGSTLRTAYDDDGNRISVKDGLGHETDFAYDPLDRNTSQTDPAERTTTYTYDRSGRQTALHDAAGRTTTLSYDAASQLQSIDYSDSQTPDVHYDYDALGRRTQMRDGSGTSSYTYDSLGRLTSTTDGSGRQLRYTYDLADRPTKVTYPADLVARTAAGQTIADPSVTRGYDDAGRVTAVTDWLGHRTEFDYDPDGNLVAQRYPNHATATMAYDHSDRLTRRSDTAADSTPILDLNYTRDTNGQLTTQPHAATQPTSTETVSYNALDQLAQTTAGSGPGAQTYSYAHDVADRLTRITSPGADTALQYDTANQLTQTTDAATGNVTQTFAYDQLGNRTSQDPTGTTPATTYGYDQANRLTSRSSPAPHAGDPDSHTTYTYDGDGLRADLLWDNAAGLPQIIADNTALYVTDPDGLPLTQLTFDGHQRYYHHDQLGSTRALTDQTGAVTARYTFEPYGTPTTDSSTTDSHFGFAGQYTDHTTGLIYMRARWYDPTTAQFITSDPIGLDSGETNLYNYAAGDPTNRIDPTGLLDLGIVNINLPSPSDVSDFAAGFGDNASFGITKRIRQALGVDYVDYCSSAYGYGNTTATGIQLALGGAAIGKAAGRIGARQLGARLAAKAETRAAEDAFEHGYKYHPRVRARGVEDPVAHNFPYSYDDVILKENPIVQSDGSLLYRKAGSINGKNGTYEVALNPETNTIFHRTWRSP